MVRLAGPRGSIPGAQPTKVPPAVGLRVALVADVLACRLSGIHPKCWVLLAHTNKKKDPQPLTRKDTIVCDQGKSHDLLCSYLEVPIVPVCSQCRGIQNRTAAYWKASSDARFFPQITSIPYRSVGLKVPREVGFLGIVPRGAAGYEMAHRSMSNPEGFLSLCRSFTCDYQQ